MNHQDVTALLLSDTPVSDLFIMEYMSDLEALPLKVYLLALAADSKKQCWRASDYCARLGCNEEALKRALLSLSIHQLIDLEADGVHFSLTDLKKLEIRNLMGLEETEQSPMDYEIYDDFIRQMNSAFFAGMMSPAWYRLIETIFSLYRFEPQVVYLLLQEAYDRSKLFPNYVSAVAKSWSERGIISFSDLEEDKQRYSQTAKLLRMVEQNLKRDLTRPEEEMVENWLRIFGYGEDIVSYALAKGVKLARPHVLATYNRLLSVWNKEGLTTLGEIERYEQKRRENQKQRPVKRKESDFSQRELPPVPLDDMDALEAMFKEEDHG